MPIIAKAQPNNYTLIPAGPQIGVCISIIDEGTQEITYQGQVKQQRKVMITWELPDETDDDMRPRVISKEYTLSLDEKANLRKDLESWRNKAFTQEELEGFDLSNILRANCQLQILHREKDGKKYANISAIMALPKGMEAQTPKNEPFVFSLDSPSSLDVMDRIPDWIKDKIKKSPEYEELVNPQILEGEDFEDFEVIASDEELPF